MHLYTPWSFSNLLPRFCFVLLCAVCLSACASSPDTAPLPEPTPVASTLRQVLAQPHSLVLLTNGSLWLTDPFTQSRAELYTLKVGESPSFVSIDTFKLSPHKKHVVWYTAGKGVFSLDLEQKQVTTVYKPSDWFNTNPYMAFMPESETVVLVDNGGKTLVVINLESGEVTTTSIPYPFGTVFKPSPNGSAFVFVSGFDQDNAQTTYMFTSQTMESQRQFATQTEHVERDQIEWLADSSGIITIENGSTLMTYDYANPENKRVFYTLPDEQKITYVKRVEDHYFVAAANEVWHVLDAAGKPYARLPIDMVADLSSPNLIPYFQDHFLVDEVFAPSAQERFHRMWLLSFKGEKKLVAPKFNEMYVESSTEGVVQ